MRPIYDLASLFAAQIRTAEEESGRVYEPLVGVVTDNKDPQRLGRVKIKFPVLSEQDTSYWAPIVMLGAGKNRGWFFIPEVDDEVLVLFEHGDMDRPVIVGALWNGKDKPADSNPGGNPRRVIKSRQGSKIIFDDDAMKLVIEDGTGKGRITFDSNGNKIIIEALEGDVCFQAPQGDLKIVAKSAEVTATQNVEIHAGDRMGWGTDGAVTIDGGPTVTISGAKVNLNCGVAQAPQAPQAEPQDIADPYEARGATGGGGGAAPAESSPQQADSSSPGGGPGGSPSNAPGSPESAPGGGESSAGGGPSSIPVGGPSPTDPASTEPQPLLISAKWSDGMVPAGTGVTLTATCVDMSGKSATFTIRDLDGDGAVVATLQGSCGDATVEAKWTTPSSGPPSSFVFEVEADGKSTESDILVVVKRVEAKLVLDEEPAANVRIKLRSEATGALLPGTTNEEGVVVFETAPLGEHTLLLEEDA